jgi:hypothetical protein
MNEPQAAEPAHASYEANRVRSRPIFIFGAALVVTTAIILLLMGGLFWRFNRQEAKTDPRPPLLANTRQPPPAPRLQISPMKDLQTIQAAEEEILSGYGWVDRPNGVVRIPISRALDLLIERGLPARIEE